ncbi:MAG: hypothetical protein ACLTW9_28455 [Enterocloster sp.]
MGGLKLSEIKKHVMTGISFMIPIVVGAGLCMALGTAIGGTKVSEAEGTLIWYIWRTGKIGMGFVVPVIYCCHRVFHRGQAGHCPRTDSGVHCIGNLYRIYRRHYCGISCGLYGTVPEKISEGA